eukprot:TRINITY_DN14128_c0_g2_i1.p1 TRINITY_DN14128_c0_g2~~TRINITY_DN14128_c0_g2_i1.p1  ORF type:complete len:138 (-),score=34.35 TRINITY_DN14128_c0_g2_i1:169-582(-)
MCIRDSPAIERAAYVSTWKSLGDSCEFKTGVDGSGALSAGVAAVQQELGKYITIVAHSVRDGAEVIFGAAKTHMGTSALVEVQLNTRTPASSSITCKGVSGAATVLAGVAELMMELFPSRGQAKTNATASALDDLFA